MPEGLRLSIGLLTVLPVGRPRAVGRPTAGRAMLWAPGVGLLLGLVGAGVMRASLAAGHPRPLAAALAIGALAVLTRGLHLDGLADTADGLGSGRPPAEALAVMRSGDVGPFGVTAVVLVLVCQTFALAAAGPWALVVAVPTGRLAVTWACRAGVPAARPDGLGALVAGTVRGSAAVALTLLVVLGAAGAVWLGAGRAPWLGPVAVLAALVVAHLLLRRCVSRLGGVTGDVLGAVVEVATTLVLVVLATR